jgi:membrane protease YdiL (CAAX protease family)
MRQFLTTLGVVWTVACIAAYVYSQQQNIPSSLTIALLPAFLVELGFYLVLGFAVVRKAFDRTGSKPVRAGLLAASAVVPYLLVSLCTGTFHFSSFLTLLAVVLVASFWYAWIGRSLPADVLFLAVLGSVYLTKTFDQIYGHAAPHLALSILGKLMWIRLTIMAVLSLRTIDDKRFGFIPALSEWRIGILHYLYFLPVGGAIGYLVHFARFHSPALVWWQVVLLVIGTFFAFLWVVALFEEFFFRAFLQRLLSQRLGSETLGLIVTSVLFGLVHLPFRQFPNWRFAIMAGVTGLFYGRAFLKGRGIRASMVTHALVVTTWRVFFYN